VLLLQETMECTREQNNFDLLALILEDNFFLCWKFLYYTNPSSAEN